MIFKMIFIYALCGLKQSSGELLTRQFSSLTYLNQILLLCPIRISTRSGQAYPGSAKNLFNYLICVFLLLGVNEAIQQPHISKSDIAALPDPNLH